MLYIDSYHEGYDWSDGITQGVKDTFASSGVELKIIRMDTKRHPEETFRVEAGAKAKAVIESFQPDVVITSDDNASKYVIVPYFMNAKLPFVFCGLNWDASIYGFPAKNVTGMVEVNSVKVWMDLVKMFAKGSRVGMIAGDTETDRKEAGFYDKILNTKVVTAYAKDFAEWKKRYRDIQNKVDILIVNNFAGINDWQDDEAKVYMRANTKVPTGTFQPGTAPYVLIGYTKVAEEQGIWAARTALRILDGVSPAGIPLATNKRGSLIVNLGLAEKMGVRVPPVLVQSANAIIK